MSKSEAGDTTFDVADLSDGDVIEMLEQLRSAHARSMWVSAFQWTRGDEAVPYLTSLLEAGHDGRGQVVPSALAMLNQRDPEAARRAAHVLLATRRGFEAHMTALDVLMTSRDPEDVDAVFTHMKKKLSNRRRIESSAGGDWELPQFIRFAAETNRLPTVARLLEDNWDHLHTHEEARIEAAWPTGERQLTAAGVVCEPRLAVLREWESETSFPAPEDGFSDVELNQARAILSQYLARSWARRKHR